MIYNYDGMIYNYVLTTKQQDNYLLLEAFLRTIPKKKFDFSVSLHECGAPGCAMGWAALLPEFNDQGLKILGSNYYWISDDSINELFGATTSGAIFYLSTLYRGKSYTDVTPEDVANAILEMLDNAVIIEEEKSK